MKKGCVLLALIVCAVCLNIIPIEAKNIKLVAPNDVKMLGSNVGILIENVAIKAKDGETSDLTKDVKYNLSLLNDLNNKLKSEYATSNDLKTRGDKLKMIYYTQLYELSLNSLDLFLNSKGKDNDYFIDSLMYKRMADDGLKLLTLKQNS